MKTSRIFFVPVSIIIFLNLNSCDVSKLDLVNPNVLTPEIYFKSETQVQQAVNAVYTTLQTQGLYQRTLYYAMDNMAYEQVMNPAAEADKMQYSNFTFDANHVELCDEQVRFNDLVRWRRLEAFIPEVLPGVVKFRRDAVRFDPAIHYLWPIPQAEINSNPAISEEDQNPGY
jgi:hypothetical protein